ncbi:MAG TPA: hypothetical protein VJT11_04145 [Nitrospiraceae bacterium]|nr:hypothetical protein [Nitrospiraceae bacterium]
MGQHQREAQHAVHSGKDTGNATGTLKRRRTIEYLRNWLKMVDSWPNGVTCESLRGSPHDEQLAEAIVAAIRNIVQREEHHGRPYKQTSAR